MSQPDIDFQRILDSAPDGIMVSDAEGKILLVNDQATRLFGYSSNELVGNSVEMLVPVNLRERHVQHREHFSAHPTTRPMGPHINLIGRRQDGTEFPVEISLSPMASNGQLLVTAVIRDVSERKRLESERERLRGELETERERHRIGMDLHDGIMQAIYAVSLTLELASEDLSEDVEEAQNSLERAIDQLHGVVRDIRSYIFDLRPRDYTGNLTIALNNLAAEFRQNSLIETRVEVAGDAEDIEQEAGIALYHVTHEALSNIRKHAAASLVVIRLERNDSLVHLDVTDDGRGFDTGEEMSETHRGLRNMGTRVRALGGDVKVASQPGKGATVSVSIPL